MKKSIDVNERFALENPSPVLRFDINARILLANPAAKEYFHLSDFAKDTLFECIPEFSTLNIDVKELITKGKRIEFESQIQDQTFQFVLQGLKEDSIGHLYSSNITKLKQAQDTLKSIYTATESVTGERFFQALVYNVTVSMNVKASFVAEIIEKTSDVNILAFWNGKNYLKSFNYNIKNSPGELIYSNQDVFYPRGVRGLFPNDVMLQELNGESYVGIPIKNSSGKVIGHLAVIDSKPIKEKDFFISILKTFGVRAVTELERMKFDTALRKSENRLHSILASSPDLHITLNPEMIVTDVYTSREDILPEGTHNISGKHIKEIFPESFCLDLEKASENLKIKNSQSNPIEFTVQSKGKTLYLSALLSVIESDKESSKENILVIHDETEQKHAQMLREEMERIVRHDLKTPLNGILGFSQLLKMENNLDENIKEQIDAIYTSGKNMLALINNSLNFFKMETGAYKIQPDLFNLMNIFHKIERELLSSIREKQIQLVYFTNGRNISHSDIFNVKGERILLESMLTNLLANAVQASPLNSTVTITLENTKKHNTIDIHNSGAIPEEIRDRFFDRYITSNKKGGTGLGTYSAKLIANTHKGEISFTTSENEGTHIIVNLPAEYDFILELS